MKKMLMVLGVLAFTASDAHAVLKVNVLGGLNFADLSSNQNLEASPKAAFSYGATLQFGALPGFDLETGLLSVGKKSERGALKIESSDRGWEIPVMLRFTLLPILDLGAGGYYAMVGDDNDVDYGAKLSARARFPLAPLTDFLLDLSYNFGLKDLDSGNPATSYTRDYALMAGVSFGL